MSSKTNCSVHVGAIVGLRYVSEDPQVCSNNSGVKLQLCSSLNLLLKPYQYLCCRRHVMGDENPKSKLICRFIRCSYFIFTLPNEA